MVIESYTETMRKPGVAVLQGRTQATKTGEPLSMRSAPDPSTAKVVSRDRTAACDVGGDEVAEGHTADITPPAAASSYILLLDGFSHVRTAVSMFPAA